MAIDTMDKLIASLGDARTNGRLGNFCKGAFTPVGGAWHAQWLQAGIPGAAAAPASGTGGEVLTDATAGAHKFTNPAGGNISYLGHLAAATSAQVGTLLIYDRLWQNSGLSATSTSAQNITPTALNRPDANGADVELWMEIYTTMGGGANVPTFQYTDQDGNTGQSGSINGYAASAIAGRCFPSQLAAGDTGVRVPTQWTNSVSMSSGTFGIVLRRRLATIILPTNGIAPVMDAIALGMPRVYDDACIEFVFHSQGTSATTLLGQFTLIQG